MDRRLELSAVPKRIGGDWRRSYRSGTRVRLEAAWRRSDRHRVPRSEFLPGFDGDVRKEANKIFKKQGFDFKLSTKVTKAERKGEGVVLTAEPAQGGRSESIEADVVLVSIGRRPNTDGLALDKAGLATTPGGQIETDPRFHTKVQGIWAIGDVIPGPMLAHKAEDEGIAVAENIAGLTGIVNENVIPSVVYTMPEIAGVGLTEEARGKGARSKSGNFRCSPTVEPKPTAKPRAS